MCLLYCDVDAEGYIVDSMIGDRIIPLKQYDYFFLLEEHIESVSAKIPRYKVINGQLTLPS